MTSKIKSSTSGRGIEGIRSLKEKNNSGLVIEALNDKEIEELKSWQPNGQTALIFDSSK